MNKKIFKKSKGYHKYFGLFLIFFLIEMSVSGIFLNHKEWIAPYDVPSWLVPSNYEVKNFNRSAIIDLLETEDFIYLAGKKGVYRAKNKENPIFKPLFNGLSPYTFHRKSYDLERFGDDVLLASEHGLYYINKHDDLWKRIPIGEKLIKKIIKKDENSLFILTHSNIYLLTREVTQTNMAISTEVSKNNFAIKKITPQKEGERIVTAVELFFHMHDGRIWGTFGRILFDIMGLAIIFLSISAFYIWFIPKRLKKRAGNLKKNRRKFRFFYTYHKKIGIYTFVLVIIISFTAIFMRPPFIIAITDVFLPRGVYAGPVSENRWKERIENGLYDPIRKRLMVQTSEYLWSWDVSDGFTKKAVHSKQDWPIFIMGATYLERNERNHYLMGSFSGLYEFNPNKNTYKSLVKGSEYSRIRPDKIAMTAGAFKYKGELYIATHLDGIKNLKGEPVVLFEQPKIMNAIDMPLWNWNFELHNGRIFKFFMGKYYILLVPFSALFFFFVLLSGFYDWYFIHKRKKKQRNNSDKPSKTP